ncbi:SpoIIE family protein phosphatase [Actinoplanes sp. NPDC051411]|uniref:SpoIIE family protein phosphatase n=1 Tax=Actinoplanes sp. NPDC051411 TaxID=3155522 RepID=UPI003421F940
MNGVYAEAVGHLRPADGEAERGTIDRAVGLLAGRARCRVAEAHRHLLRTAGERHQAVAEVAASVLRLLDTADPAGLPESLPRMVDTALDGPGLAPPVAPFRRFEPWLAMVQRVLDVVPGMTAFLVPERDDRGALTDLIWAAASPEAVAVNGLRGSRLIGTRVSALPGVVGSERWTAYESVLDTGCPAEVTPFRVGDATFSVRAHRLGQGLVVNWIRQAGERPGAAERLAGTERLGNLGWGEWDLVSGEIYWSPQLYRIYERDPDLGPHSIEEGEAMAVADDHSLRVAALHAFQRQETIDITTRMRVGGRIKHLRTVADAVRDAAGNPLRVYGIVQDVTDSEAGARRLAEVERQLDEQRRTLDAEHKMAGELQRIILPLPDGPIELPGVKVAVRYLPAGQEGLVGGDWYHAAELRDGSVLLAIGDVAGHGTPAATTMAQLRHAVRALSVTTGDPGTLLGHLNQLVCDLERETPELSATAVIARFDPVRRELLWAQAGHPPPLLSRGGRTAPLRRPSGPLLGVVEDAAYPTARLDFHPGDLLLLYTDGLVEHRRRGLDDGLASVIAAVDDAVRASPEQPLGQVLSRLRQANPDDDTCILAVRPTTGATRDLRGYLNRG